MSTKWARWLLSGMVILMVSACASIGPATIARDRIDYAEALAEAGKRVMLLNIVKLRFGDIPTLLSTDQLVAGYSLEGRVNVGTDFLQPDLRLADDIAVGAGGTFADRPTITYSPVEGDAYARMMLTPLPPYELLAMMASGATGSAILRLAVKSINGLSSEAASIASPDGEVLALAGILSREGKIGLQFEGRGEARRVSLLINEAPDGALDPRVRRLLSLLQLDLSRRSFPIVFGFGRGRTDEIAIYTRSLIEILNALAAEIEVPEAAVAAGRTAPNRAPAQTPGMSLRVRSQPMRPADAFVAVEYGGVWYAIDDRDLASKRMFSLLMILAAVMDGAGPSPLPVIAIPTG